MFLRHDGRQRAGWIVTHECSQESVRVSVITERTAGVAPATMATLVFTVFTVSAGLGVVLPLLPCQVMNLAQQQAIRPSCAVAYGW